MRLRGGDLVKVNPYNPNNNGHELLSLPEDGLLAGTSVPMIPLSLIPQIVKLKLEYQNAFLVELSGYKVLHRLLTRAEYDTYTSLIITNGDSEILRQAIAQMAVARIISPSGDMHEDFNTIKDSELKAYTIPSICNHILELSSFSKPEYLEELQDLNEKNISRGSLDSVLNWHIKSNLNNITNKELSQMNIAQYGEAFGAISYYTEGKARLEFSQKQDNLVQSLEQYIPIL